MTKINGKTVTCTNGNAINGISGSRITVKDSEGKIIARFEVPKRYGVKYCESHPDGVYGRKYFRAIEA